MDNSLKNARTKMLNKSSFVRQLAKLSSLLVCYILLDLFGNAIPGYGILHVSADIDVKCHNQLASSFGSMMAVKLDLFSGHQVIKSIYENRQSRREFVVHGMEGMRLTQKMADDLGKMLRKKREAVKKLVDVLEEESRRFAWNTTKEPSYYNVEFLNENKNNVPERVVEEYGKQIQPLELESDSRFLDRPISLNQSVVQVPFDVYSKGVEVLRGVQWSKAIGEQFRKNLENDPSMKWQYFGSTEGFMRMYPGFQWKMTTKFLHPNVYDCRIRNWYVEAATYPKDMLILVDNSGSMTGLKMAIAAHVVDTLLQTLGDNDFFNVLTYSKDVHFVEPCFNDTLVRADNENKNRVKEALLHSNTSEVADLSNALDVAFNVMLQFHESGSGSDCYSSIMIITDGATNSYQPVMDKYMNETSRQIRIFSYLIGADKAYLQPVRDIACNNYGFFQQVESRNDVAEKVLRYLTVMNRPQAFKEDHHTIWTKPYYDLTNIDRGFGLITTVSTPVYLLHRTVSAPLMLGVAATDVPISLMLNSINIHKCGVNSYVFIVTNNGYVVTHPRLVTTYETVRDKEKIKPNYNSVDIDTMEGNDQNETLRNSLLLRKKGSVKAKNVVFPLLNWSRAMVISGTYYFAPIADSPFIIGMFQPDGYGEVKLDYAHSLKEKRSGPTYDEKQCDKVNKHLMENYPSMESLNRVSAICSLNFSEIQVSEEWQYCSSRNFEVFKYKSGRKMSQLDLIKTYFFTKDDNIVCDGDLLNSLLFDVYVTAPLHPVWAEHNTYRNTTNEGIVMTFIMTKSGASRQYWYEDSSPLFSTVQEELKSFNRQNFPPFYRRTVANSRKNTWVYTLLSGGTYWQQTNSLMITQAVRRGGAVLGVIGIVMKITHFNRFWEETKISSGIGCSEETYTSYNCYIIDDNGIIILSSNTSSDVGKPLGEVDGQVTRYLVDNNIFSILTLKDAGTMCVDSTSYGNMGGSAMSSVFLNPFVSVSSYIKWWTQEFAVLLTNLVVLNLWTFFTNSGADATFSKYNEDLVHYRVCDVKYDILTVNYDMVPFSSKTDCTDECTRDIGIQRINQSNLFLVVAQNLNNIDCDCSNDTKPLIFEREEMTYVGEDKCERLRDHKMRRKPNGCKSHHSMDLEDQTSLPCESNSASSMFQSSGWVKVQRSSKTSQGSYSYLMLSISWFLPYLLYMLLNLSDQTVVNLPPFA